MAKKVAKKKTSTRKSPFPSTCTQSEFAGLLGLSLERVRKMVTEELIVLDTRKQVKVRDSIRSMVSARHSNSAEKKKYWDAVKAMQSCHAYDDELARTIRAAVIQEIGSSLQGVRRAIVEIARDDEEFAENVIREIDAAMEELAK